MDNAMVSIGEYAKSNGVSFQAVSQQVKRYQKELEGHIVKQGKTRYLDHDAVAFLDSHRSATPISVYNKETHQELEELKLKNQELLEKLNASYEVVITLQSQKVELLEENHAMKLLIESNKGNDTAEAPTTEDSTAGAEVPTEEPKAPQEGTGESTATEETTAPKANRFARAWRELWK